MKHLAGKLTMTGLVLMDDRPGGLHRIAKAFGQRKINMEDAYGFVIQDKKQAVLVVDVERISEAKKAHYEKSHQQPLPPRMRRRGM
jgi:hypothetical protein